MLLEPREEYGDVIGPDIVDVTLKNIRVVWCRNLAGLIHQPLERRQSERDSLE